MQSDRLNLTNFRKAIKSFDKALKAYKKDSENDLIRDACIKRFEYCYFLSINMIKRHLKLAEELPSEIDHMNLQDTIRLAYRVGMIPNSWDKWRKYRDNRAATAHGYDEDQAEDVAADLHQFYTEIKTILNNLSRIHET